MKIYYILFLIFAAFFHFILPHLFYEKVGFLSGYFAQGDKFFHKDSYYLCMYLNVASLLIASAIVFFIPLNNKMKMSTSKYPNLFYYSAMAFGFFFMYYSGGHSGVLQGKLLGTWASYLGLFLGSTTVLLLTICYLGNSNVIVILMSYILISVLSGSRSAPVFLIVSFFIYMSANQSRKRVIAYLSMVVFASLSSFYFFDVATKIRENTNLNLQTASESFITTTEKPVFSPETSNYFQEIASKIYPIVTRVSYLENGMIPIMFKDQNLDSEKLKLFYEKYSLFSQLNLFKNYFFPAKFKNAVNEVFPNLFEFDLPANQYYRQIFLNYSREQVFSRYMSINLTFPVYVYMYSNAYVAVLVYVLVIVGMFVSFNFLIPRYPLSSIVLMSSLYNLMTFFDLTDYLVTLQRSFLTVFTFWFFYLLVDKGSTLLNSMTQRRKDAKFSQVQSIKSDYSN